MENNGGCRRVKMRDEWGGGQEKETAGRLMRPPGVRLQHLVCYSVFQTDGEIQLAGINLLWLWCRNGDKNNKQLR